MKFKNLVIMCAVLVISPKAFSWGKIGHRVVAEIAERNLDASAKKGIKDLLGTDTLARVANFYTSIPTGKTYFDQKRNKEGDIIEALFRMDETLRDPKKSKDEKVLALKFLVHLMGDVHQPLHVGIAEDRGGNSVHVKWFKEDSNLHSIWDESIINFQELSYSEYSTFLNHFTKDEKTNISIGNFIDWAKESQDLRSVVYETGTTGKLSYEYQFKAKPVVEERLRRAGLRLATVLNNIFKKTKHDKKFLELRLKVKDNV